MSKCNSEEKNQPNMNDERKNIQLILKSTWEQMNTNSEDVLRQIEAAMELSKLYGYQAEYAECYLLLAKHEIDIDSLEQIDTMLEVAFRIFTEQNNIVGLVRTHRMYSLYYLSIGNLDQCLTSCLTGLNLIEDNQLKIMEGIQPIEFSLLNNMSSTYEYADKFHEALEILLRAYEFVKDSNNDSTIVALTNISNIYVKINELQQALEYCDIALAVTEKNNLSPIMFSFCNHQYGLIYKFTGNTEKAIAYFQDAIHYLEIDNSKYYLVDALYELGELYLNVNELILSRDYLEKALEIAISIDANAKILDLQNQLAQNYEKSGEFSKALSYYKKYLQSHKDIMSKELQQKTEICSIQLKAESAEKDAEIFRLKNVELKTKNEEIKLKASELEESYKNIAVISEIGQKITASLNIEEVLDAIYDNIKTLMQVNVMGVGLFDESTGIINYKMFIEEGIRVPEFTSNINYENTFASRCVQTRKEVFINDATETPTIFAELDIIDKEPRSIIYYPLILAGKVIGVFTVQSYESYTYSDRNLDAIKALASYIAIALNNSQKSDALHHMIRELEVLSTTDSLTGLYNRRYIQERIHDEYSLCIDQGSRFCILIADIDHFKIINDTYGHECGDFIIKEISTIFLSGTRESDYVSRWGGEEYLILLASSDIKMAFIIAERLRFTIQNHIFCYNDQEIKVTMTFGIAEFQSDLDIDAIIRRADQVLYKGKENGRNNVQVYKSL